MSFLPDLSVILAFAAAAFVLAITPGPDMALQMSRAINHGFWHGIAVGFGAMSGIVVHTTLAAVGISVLIVAAPADAADRATEGDEDSGAKLAADSLVHHFPVGVLAGELGHDGLHHPAHVLR